MREKQEAGRGTAIARRLRAVLEAEHIPTQGAFAVRLGIEQQRLNNAFRGYPLSIDLAQRIKRAVPGMTLDWLYDGDEAGLPVSLRNRLRDAETRLGADDATTL